jgi:hypothetical protein
MSHYDEYYESLAKEAQQLVASKNHYKTKDQENTEQITERLNEIERRLGMLTQNQKKGSYVF